MKLKTLFILALFTSLQASGTVLSHSPYVYDYSKVEKPKLVSKKSGVSNENDYETIGSFEVAFIDEEGVGVRDLEPYTTPQGELTTLGNYRKQIISAVVEAYSMQIHLGEFTPQINIGFKEHEGFLAITHGPFYSESWSSDPYGIIEQERNYPATLAYALESNAIKSDVSTTYLGAGDRLLEFSNGMSLPDLAYVVFHELTHVVGFIATDCPSANVCKPEPSIKQDHMQKFFVYNDGENIVPYESLDMNGRLEAMLSGNGVWFSGSQDTRNAIADELLSGHDDGRIFMHADPQLYGPYEGDFDGQSGSHVSFDIQPVQLMYSAGAFVDDLGVASFILCDVGWCRNEGKVIDLQVEAVISGNTTEAGNAIINIDFQNNSNSNIEGFIAEVTYLDGLNVISVIDPDLLCVEIAGGLSCSGSITALDEQSISLEVEPSENYPIGGWLKSSGFDVDRSGFNNILAIKKNVAPVIQCDGKPVEDGGICQLELSTSVAKTYVTQLRAFDPNGDTINYEFTKVGDALDFTVEGESNNVLVLLGPDHPGRWVKTTYEVTFDDGQLSKKITLDITNAIYEENEAPSLTCSNNGTIPCPLSLGGTGEVLIDNYTYFDNNSGDYLTFSWSAQAEAFPFTTTGELGQYLIVELPEDFQSWETVTYTLTISDGLAETSLDFEITNVTYEPNTAPEIGCAIAGCEYEVDGVGEYAFNDHTVTDNNLDNVTYQWTANEGTFDFTVSGEKEDKLTILFPESVDRSWESISYRLTVKDGEFSTSQVFTFTNRSYDPIGGSGGGTPTTEPITTQTPSTQRSDSSGGGSISIYWLSLLLFLMTIRISGIKVNN